MMRTSMDRTQWLKIFLAICITFAHAEASGRTVWIEYINPGVVDLRTNRFDGAGSRLKNFSGNPPVVRINGALILIKKSDGTTLSSTSSESQTWAYRFDASIDEETSLELWICTKDANGRFRVRRPGKTVSMCGTTRAIRPTSVDDNGTLHYDFSTVGQNFVGEDEVVTKAFNVYLAARQFVSTVVADSALLTREWGKTFGMVHISFDGTDFHEPHCGNTGGSGCTIVSPGMTDPWRILLGAQTYSLNHHVSHELGHTVLYTLFETEYYGANLNYGENGGWTLDEKEYGRGVFQESLATIYSLYAHFAPNSATANVFFGSDAIEVDDHDVDCPAYADDAWRKPGNGVKYLWDLIDTHKDYRRVEFANGDAFDVVDEYDFTVNDINAALDFFPDCFTDLCKMEERYWADEQPNLLDFNVWFSFLTGSYSSPFGMNCLEGTP